MFTPFFASETLTGFTKLQEYGLVGILILAIIVFMGLLLRHTLNQAKEDRDLWVRQSDKFITSQERISENMVTVTFTLKEVSSELKHLREKVEKLESKHEAVPPVPADRPDFYPYQRRRNGGGPESPREG